MKHQTTAFKSAKCREVSSGATLGRFEGFLFAKMKLTKEYKTEVFLNEEKELIIHQEDANGIDHYIIVHGKARASELISALQEALKDMECES